MGVHTRGACLCCKIAGKVWWQGLQYGLYKHIGTPGYSLMFLAHAGIWAAAASLLFLATPVRLKLAQVCLHKLQSHLQLQCRHTQSLSSVTTELHTNSEFVHERAVSADVRSCKVRRALQFHEVSGSWEPLRSHIGLDFSDMLSCGSTEAGSYLVCSITFPQAVSPNLFQRTH